MTRLASDSRRAFTLLEVLLVIALIAILSAIVYAAFAPVRERALETRCLAHLHQISQAIQMYRQDAGGGDPPAATTVSQLGLPRSQGSLWQLGYVRERDLWYCPREYWGPEENVVMGDPKFRTTSYMWFIRPEDQPRPDKVPSFAARVTTRGDDTPLMADPHHGGFMRPDGASSFLVLTMRLGGEVKRTRVPRTAQATWEW